MCRVATLGLLVVIFLPVPKAEAQTPHFIIGIWDLNAEQSASEPDPAYQTSVYRFIEAENGFISFTRITINVNGEPSWAQSSFKFDGEAYPVYTRGSLRRSMTAGVESPAMRVFSAPDAYTIDDASASGQGIPSTFEVSLDGQTLTVTRIGTNTEGQAVRSVFVHDRVQ